MHSGGKLVDKICDFAICSSLRILMHITCSTSRNRTKPSLLNPEHNNVKEKRKKSPPTAQFPVLYSVM